MDEEVPALLGETHNLDYLVGRVDSASFMAIFICGPPGSGKTLLLECFRERIARTSGVRVIDLGKLVSDNKILLDPLGNDIESLNASELFKVEGDTRIVAIYDDVDNHVLSIGLEEWLLFFAENPSNLLIVLSMKNAPAIPGFSSDIVEVLLVGAERGSFEDFERYLSSYFPSNIDIYSEFTHETVQTLQRFTQTCEDFNVVRSVIATCVQRAGGVDRELSTEDLVTVFTSAESHIQQMPFVFSVTAREDGEPSIEFRRKEKTERLRDLLLYYYRDRSEFEEAAAEVLPAYDSSKYPYLDYSESVLCLCFEYSPYEIIKGMLGPRDIQQEVAKLGLGKTTLLPSLDDKIRALLDSLGFSMVDTHEGFFSIESAIHSYMTTLQSKEVKAEHIRGIALSLFQEMERALRNLLEFYGSLCLGSFRRLVDRYRSTNPDGIKNPNRLTFGQHVNLMEFLASDKCRKLVRLKLKELDIDRLFPFSTLERLRKVSGIRTEFAHVTDESGTADDHYYRERAILACETSLEVLADLRREHILPEVVRVKQIIFDEYGRRMINSESDRKEVISFIFTDSVTAEQVKISDLYYILREHPGVLINPVIMLKQTKLSHRLFTSAEDYRKHSRTQEMQGAKLLEFVEIKPGDKILDVGCGDGRFTLEILMRTSDVSILGIDISTEMVESACALAAERGISQANFAVMDVLDIDMEREFDLVVSNSSMHWVTPPERGYGVIYRSIKAGGRLAVHQGGCNTYKGMHECVMAVIHDMELESFFKHWKYPAYYPRREELQELLTHLGFSEVEVISIESDGEEYEELAMDFARAGLLPYLAQIPDKIRKQFKDTFVEIASQPLVSNYSHRLFAFAKKE